MPMIPKGLFEPSRVSNGSDVTDLLAAKSFVKICGVRTVHDALAVREHGGDAVGVNFTTSKRGVSMAQTQRIVEGSPEIGHVGIFRDNDDEFVRQAIEISGVEAVQIHGALSRAFASELRDRGVVVVKALSIDEEDFVAFDESMVDAVLVDGPTPGSGEPYERSMVSKRGFRVPVIVAGGLTVNNVADVIRELGPWGVDVASGVENSSGETDVDLVSTFIGRAREAFNRREAP